jgi:hypothetical protein
MTDDQRRAFVAAHSAVNDRPWAGFGPACVRLRWSNLTGRPDGLFDFAADFDVDVTGTADRLKPAPLLGRKQADELMSHRVFATADFGAIFGDDPQFDPEPVTAK